MRVFCLIQGVAHQRAYVHKMGLGQICAQDFDLTDYRNTQKHNSNPRVNSSDENFVTFEQSQGGEDELCHHTLLEDCFQKIKREKPEIDIEKDLWEPIFDTVVKTIGAFRPSVEARAEEWLGQKLPDHLDDRCWQLIGYDIAFDADFKPIFFEANAQTRQTISMMVKQPDGSFVPGVSSFFPKVFPPLLK